MLFKLTVMKIEATKFIANTDETDPFMVELACESILPKARSICFGIFKTTGLKSLLIFVPSSAVKLEFFHDSLSLSLSKPIDIFNGY